MASPTIGLWLAVPNAVSTLLEAVRRTLTG